MDNKMQIIYLLQQRADIYADIMQKLVTGIIEEFSNSKDQNTKKNLQNLIFNVEPQIKQIDENIKKYQNKMNDISVKNNI